MRDPDRRSPGSGDGAATGTAPRPHPVVVHHPFADADIATLFARDAAELGWDVRVEKPDDADGLYHVECSQIFVGGAAEEYEAQRQLDEIAEDLCCMDDEAHEESQESA